MSEEKANKITKSSKNTKPVKQYTVDEVRDVLRRELYYKGHPTLLLEKMAAAIPEVLQGKNKQKYDELLQEVAQIMNLDNHVLLFKSAGTGYESFGVEFASLLITEYNCTSPSEKALAQAITSAYIRSIKYAEMLSVNISGDRPITKELNNYYNFLSKEIDRAQRQYITGLQTLKQLKSPSLPVTIKTTTAYIAENQQVNSVTQPKNDEINKPK